MGILEIFLIALGLAMDAFAVAIANGVIIKDVKIKHALVFGLYFGIFQLVMPILGWLIGMTFAGYIMAFGNWIASIVLCLIGFNMIIESVKKEKDAPIKSNEAIFRWQNMAILAVATSIDAMAVGVSFAVMESNIWLSSLIIGAVAFALSVIGVLIGDKMGRFFKKGAETFGGIILILIGVKILIEHLL